MFRLVPADGAAGHGERAILDVHTAAFPFCLVSGDRTAAHGEGAAAEHTGSDSAFVPGDRAAFQDERAAMAHVYAGTFIGSRDRTGFLSGSIGQLQGCAIGNAEHRTLVRQFKRVTVQVKNPCAAGCADRCGRFGLHIREQLHGRFAFGSVQGRQGLCIVEINCCAAPRCHGGDCLHRHRLAQGLRSVLVGGDRNGRVHGRHARRDGPGIDSPHGCGLCAHLDGAGFIRVKLHRVGVLSAHAPEHGLVRRVFRDNPGRQFLDAARGHINRRRERHTAHRDSLHRQIAAGGYRAVLVAGDGHRDAAFLHAFCVDGPHCRGAHRERVLAGFIRIQFHFQSAGAPLDLPVGSFGRFDRGCQLHRIAYVQRFVRCRREGQARLTDIFILQPDGFCFIYEIDL